MKSRILCLPPAKITPGMMLAKAITDRDGHTLLAAETRLELEMLDRLVRRGIESVFILATDTRDEETITRELLDAQARVENIFRGKTSPAREALHAAILDFRLESTR